MWESTTNYVISYLCLFSKFKSFHFIRNLLSSICVVCVKGCFYPGSYFTIGSSDQVCSPSLSWVDHILCMPHTGGGAGHGNVHHYTLISNAPQPINNNSQSGKLPRVFKAWPYTAHLGCVGLWRANINYGFQKGQNVGNTEILHAAQMFVYVCAMLRHNAHCVVRPTTERRVRREEGVFD